MSRSILGGFIRTLRFLFPALVLFAPVAAADVLIVYKGSPQGFTTVQGAINAAQDGDIILVRSGTYPTFTVGMRSLTIRADLGAEVVITPGVSVLDTPAGGTVLLADLEIRGKMSVSPAQPGGSALTLANNQGYVRVQGCTLIGGDGPITPPQVPPPGAGGDACVVATSPQTAFVDCVLEGGVGGGNVFQGSFGGAGGRGLRVSLSGVALYDCVAQGGVGGAADVFLTSTGGHAGAGGEFFDGGSFASNTLFRGGQGGHAGIGGTGGDGLIVHAAAQMQLLDTKTQGGNGGGGEMGPNGSKGLGSSGGGQILVLPGASRVLDAPSLAVDGSSLGLVVEGEPGDAIWVVPSQAPAHVPALGASGVWLVARPGFLTKAPLVVLGPSGTANVQFPAPELDAAQGSRTLFLQAFALGTDGKLTLGSPAHVSVFECESQLPDCNGSGAFDLCDVLAGTSPDCDGNATPDECDADCNVNGVPDACDIASGTSEDKNNNGIADECEPHGITWYVDKLAVPGGDGSAGSPFKTIGDAVSISLGGDTILVGPGVYKGAMNRNLILNGRDLVILGTGGSAACVIDCETEKPAFIAQDGETAASRIEGFTIRDGRSVTLGGGIRLDGANTTIRDIVFSSCHASDAGGGLDLTDSNAEVSGCRFEVNDASHGGGLSIHGGSPHVSFCTFVGNFGSHGGGAPHGGAIYVSTSLGVLLTHLDVIDNDSDWGGGLMVESGSVNVGNCLFAGNYATQGGAIRTRKGNLYVRGTTFQGNRSNLKGAIYSENTDGLPRNLRLDNTVAWDDPSANGGLILNVSPGVTIQIERCDLRGGPGSIVVAAGSTLAWGAGNFDLDPFFADPDGLDGNPLTFGDNDYRLSPASPCIDAGDNGMVIPDFFDLDGDGDLLELTPIDLDGLSRFVDDPNVPDTGAGTPPIVDLGPYERP